MLEMGHRFGDYELLKKIGSGGMAEVWVARRVVGVGSAAKSVAIKVLRKRSAVDSRAHQSFVEEARLSMLLTHSNIVQVFDAGSHGERHYLVMEWVDGVDLAAIAHRYRERGQPLPDAVTAHCIAGVLQGLEYAHSLTHKGGTFGVIHRDVSPHNVLLSVSGEVKITDFGIARQVSEDTSGQHIKGKLRYMAPEQLLGDSRKPSVDLYSVGAIVHELLDGCRFRQGSRMDELQLLTRRGEIPPLRRGDVPPQLDALRLGLLEPDPAQRIASASDALELLRSWPGFRDATYQLARIVRAHVGVTGPRVSDNLFPPVAGGSNTRLMPDSPDAAPDETPSQLAGVEGAQTQTELGNVLEAPVPVQFPRMMWGILLALGCAASYVLWVLTQPAATDSRDLGPEAVVEDRRQLDVPAPKLRAVVEGTTDEKLPEIAEIPTQEHVEDESTGSAPAQPRRHRACGNGRCETQRGETCHSCARDCPCAGARACVQWDGRYQCTASAQSLKE